MKIFALVALAPLWVPPHAKGQAQSPLEFDVVSVKPSAPGGRGGGIRPLPGGANLHRRKCPGKADH